MLIQLTSEEIELLYTALLVYKCSANDAELNDYLLKKLQIYIK